MLSRLVPKSSLYRSQLLFQIFFSGYLLFLDRIWIGIYKCFPIGYRLIPGVVQRIMVARIPLVVKDVLYIKLNG